MRLAYSGRLGGCPGRSDERRAASVAGRAFGKGCSRPRTRSGLAQRRAQCRPIAASIVRQLSLRRTDLRRAHPAIISQGRITSMTALLLRAIRKLTGTVRQAFGSEPEWRKHKRDVDREFD